MNKARPAGIIVLILAIVTASSLLFAVCAQNSDVIHLSLNGKRITSSEFVLVSKNKNGGYTLASYCLDGTCFSRFHSGDVSNVYFVRVTDDVLLKKMKDAIGAKEKSVVEGNQGLASEKYERTKNLYVSEGLCANSPLNGMIAEKIDGFKKYPFLKINSVKNYFSFDYCSYTRVMTYDLATNRISVEENGKKPPDDNL